MCTEVQAASCVVNAELTHVFASESSSPVRKLLQAYLPPYILYKDVKDRVMKDVPGDLDIYCSGFPCQPFSLAGLMLGTADVARGMVALHVVEYILKKTPKSFILENVPGLVQAHEETFKALVEALQSTGQYEVLASCQTHSQQSSLSTISHLQGLPIWG